MSDPRQKTDMSDELTTIARKSYGESAIFVKCTSGSPKFWFYLGRRLVSEHDAASHAEAFRELKLKPCLSGLDPHGARAAYGKRRAVPVGRYLAGAAS